MPKRGRHEHDENDPRVSKGVNNSEQATRMTPGTPKQRETYEQNAREHKSNADPVGGPCGKTWEEDTRRGRNQPGAKAVTVGQG